MAYLSRALSRLRKDRTAPATEDWTLRKIAEGGGSGGGPVAWADVTGKPSTFTPSAHTHPTSEVTGLDAALAGKQPSGAYETTTELNARDTNNRSRANHTGSQLSATISDLAATVKAYTLDEFANPVASLDFAQQQTLQFVIENRTSDPGSPVSGQIWLRTDL